MGPLNKDVSSFVQVYAEFQNLVILISSMGFDVVWVITFWSDWLSTGNDLWDRLIIIHFIVIFTSCLAVVIKVLTLLIFHSHSLSVFFTTSKSSGKSMATL